MFVSSSAESDPQTGDAWADAPWIGDDPFAGMTVPPPMPEMPAWVAEAPGGDVEAIEADMDAWLAQLPPEDRFAHQFGHLPTDVELDRFAPATLERAAALQDLAVQAAQVRAVADAHRIAALLTAHDASIADLTARFGSKIADRHGMGGTAFATTIALLTRTDPRHLQHEITAGLTLRDRLPATWAAFRAGDTTWNRAQKAVTEADGLDSDVWAAYDAEAARIVVSSTRVKRDLKRVRERLQDDTAAKRARTTFERRNATLEIGSGSGVAFVVQGLATTWLPRQEAVHRLAIAAHGVDPQQRTVGQLRHDILERIFDLGLAAYEHSAAGGDEVVPARTKVKVQLTLTVPALAWLGHTKEQAILDGFGPISMEQAKGLAGDAGSFVRVLTDPVTGVRLAMDRTVYAPPPDLARWVRIRDGRTRFPGKSTPAHLADIDHAREWQHLGRTEDSNLITLDRPSHNAKTAGLYRDELLDDGIVDITDPWGHTFHDPPDEPMDPAPAHLLPPPAPADDTCPF